MTDVWKMRGAVMYAIDPSVKTEQQLSGRITSHVTTMRWSSDGRPHGLSGTSRCSLLSWTRPRTRVSPPSSTVYKEISVGRNVPLLVRHVRRIVDARPC